MLPPTPETTPTTGVQGVYANENPEPATIPIMAHRADPAEVRRLRRRLLELILENQQRRESLRRSKGVG